MMKIWSESRIGYDGVQSIVIMAKEPKVNEHDLYTGGKFYSFSVNHKKQTTTMYEYYFTNGVANGCDKVLRRWKDEVLTAKECLKYCEETYGE